MQVIIIFKLGFLNQKDFIHCIHHDTLILWLAIMNTVACTDIIISLYSFFAVQSVINEIQGNCDEWCNVTLACLHHHLKRYHIHHHQSLKHELNVM